MQVFLFTFSHIGSTTKCLNCPNVIKTVVNHKTIYVHMYIYEYKYRTKLKDESKWLKGSKNWNIFIYWINLKTRYHKVDFQK